MKEKLQEYALIAEIVGAICIVVSLIFVGLQIRQSSEQVSMNTTATQETTNQAILEEFNSWRLAVGSDPELVGIISLPIDELTEIQQSQRVLLMDSFWGVLERAYTAKSNGVLDDSSWRRFYAAICLTKEYQPESLTSVFIGEDFKQAINSCPVEP